MVCSVLKYLAQSEVMNVYVANIREGNIEGLFVKNAV
jgi:hypothetical protein